MFTSLTAAVVLVIGCLAVIHDHAGEHSDARFIYEPDSGMFGMRLLVHHHHRCYAYNMTSQEHAAIHTSDGLASVEEKMLRLAGTVTHPTPLTHGDMVQQLSRNFANFCIHTPTFLLN